MEEVRPVVGDAHGVELRGYEVARRAPNGRWIQCSHFRPSNLGFKQALADAQSLNGKYPNETYRVRPILSLEPPPAAELEQESAAANTELLQPAPTEVTNG